MVLVNKIRWNVEIRLYPKHWYILVLKL